MKIFHKNFLPCLNYLTGNIYDFANADEAKRAVCLLWNCSGFDFRYARIPRVKMLGAEGDEFQEVHFAE